MKTLTKLNKDQKTIENAIGALDIAASFHNVALGIHAHLAEAIAGIAGDTVEKMDKWYDLKSKVDAASSPKEKENIISTFGTKNKIKNVGEKYEYFNALVTECVWLDGFQQIPPHLIK